MKPPDILPTLQVPTGEAFEGATVLPFNDRAAHLKKVVDSRLEGTDAVLALLDAFRQRIVDGETPTAVIICVIENTGDTEKSYGLSTGLTRMEVIGNLHALATEITVEAS